MKLGRRHKSHHKGRGTGSLVSIVSYSRLSVLRRTLENGEKFIILRTILALKNSNNILLQGCGQVEEGAGGGGGEGDGGGVRGRHQEPRAAHYARLGEDYSYHATNCWANNFIVSKQSILLLWSI